MSGYRWLSILTLLIPLSFSGCGRGLAPDRQDVPPGVRSIPGVYTDLDPRWSHDGKRIAFLRATTDRHLQLFIVEPKLKRPLALLEDELVSPDRPYSPELQRYCSPDTLSWSPDDRQIAFERIEWFTFEDGERLPGTGLWSLDLHSGRVVPLALHKTAYKSIFYYFHTPHWSPDGRYLAYVGEGISGQRVLFIRPLAAQKVKEVEPRFDNYADSDWPVWRPVAGAGGAPVLAFRQGIVHALSAPDTETLRLLQPGGQGSSGHTHLPGEIWRMRAREYAPLLPAGSEQTAIAPRAAHPAWSPDGLRLVFTLTPDANNYNRYELWMIGGAGQDPHRVSPHDGRGYFAPVWIDAQHIGALSPRGNLFDVVSVDLISGQKRTIGSIPSSDCDWSPDRSSIVYASPENARQGKATTLRSFDTRLTAGAKSPGDESTASVR